MQVDGPEKIRNLAVSGHNSIGKTTLVSALQYTAGVANRLNRVEDGNTITDFDPEEIERGISIGLATCFLPWRNHKVNLIDCPGYGIFFAETRAGIAASDGVLLCVDAVSGVEVTTEKVWEVTSAAGTPVMLHLTRMERERADFDRVVEQLRETFDRRVAPIHLPIGKESEFEGVIDLLGQKAYTFKRDGNGKAKASDIPDDLKEAAKARRDQLVEAIAETDDALLEKFFEDGTLSDDELTRGLREAIAAGKIFPLTVSSAGHGIANSCLLDAIVDLLPAPVDREAFPATDIGGEPIELKPDPKGSPAALVFKTLSDPFSGKISLLRVVRGTLDTDTTYWNVQQETDERVGHLLAMQGKVGSDVKHLVTGDIGGVAKLKHAHSGETLSDKDHPVKLGWIPVREPAMAFALEPKSKGDDEKIGEALTRLMEEDLTLHAGRDAATGEYLISGTGQLHVEIAVSKLKRRFQVEVILHPPRVPYRETIRKKAGGHGRHKKQSGGRGQFADCRIEIEPLPRGEDFEFLDEIFGGSIPQNYRPAVHKGIEEARQRGFLAGYPMVDFRVRLKDGQHHDVDSSEMAFKIAGSLAYKEAMAKAAPILLEPMMSVDISTNEEFMGDIMSDLSQRRGRPLGVEVKNEVQHIKAVVPMAEMLDYSPAITAMTQGRARFHMEFSHYDPVPKAVQVKIIAETQQAKEQG